MSPSWHEGDSRVCKAVSRPPRELPLERDASSHKSRISCGISVPQGAKSQAHVPTFCIFDGRGHPFQTPDIRFRSVYSLKRRETPPLLLARIFFLCRKHFSAFISSARQHFSPIRSSHSFTESMFFAPLPFFRLIGSFHATAPPISDVSSLFSSYRHLFPTIIMNFPPFVKPLFHRSAFFFFPHPSFPEK